jgi:signal transduction histidine kinase
MLLAENEVVAGEPAASELLSIIISESDDLARMVEDLLTTARLDAGALHFVFEDVDVEIEMPETVDPLTRSGSVISVDVSAGIVRTDRLRFRQLIRNLLSNARKYGGDHIRVEGRVEGRTYVCSVIDDGAGVPTEIEHLLFQRFIHQGHQTATKDSVGLGLSIVHALAQGMGGSISYARINEETYFTIRLPLAGIEKIGLRSVEGGPAGAPTVSGYEEPTGRLASGSG